jgi:hypothetical protein
MWKLTQKKTLEYPQSMFQDYSLDYVCEFKMVSREKEKQSQDYCWSKKWFELEHPNCIFHMIMFVDSKW